MDVYSDDLLIIKNNKNYRGKCVDIPSPAKSIEQNKEYLIHDHVSLSDLAEESLVNDSVDNENHYIQNQNQAQFENLHNSIPTEIKNLDISYNNNQDEKEKDKLNQNKDLTKMNNNVLNFTKIFNAKIDSQHNKLARNVAINSSHNKYKLETSLSYSRINYNDSQKYMNKFKVNNVSTAEVNSERSENDISYNNITQIDSQYSLLSKQIRTNNLQLDIESNHMDQKKTTFNDLPEIDDLISFNEDNNEIQVKTIETKKSKFQDLLTSDVSSSNGSTSSNYSQHRNSNDMLEILYTDFSPITKILSPSGSNITIDETVENVRNIEKCAARNVTCGSGFCSILINLKKYFNSKTFIIKIQDIYQKITNTGSKIRKKGQEFGGKIIHVIKYMFKKVLINSANQQKFILAFKRILLLIFYIMSTLSTVASELLMLIRKYLKDSIELKYFDTSINKVKKLEIDNPINLSERDVEKATIIIEPLHLHKNDTDVRGSDQNWMQSRILDHHLKLKFEENKINFDKKFQSQLLYCKENNSTTSNCQSQNKCKLNILGDLNNENNFQGRDQENVEINNNSDNFSINFNFKNVNRNSNTQSNLSNIKRDFINKNLCDQKTWYINKAGSIEYSSPGLIKYSSPRPTEYTQAGSIEYSSPGPIEYTQPEPIEYTQPRSIKYTQPRSIENIQPGSIEHIRPNLDRKFISPSSIINRHSTLQKQKFHGTMNATAEYEKDILSIPQSKTYSTTGNTTTGNIPPNNNSVNEYNIRSDHSNNNSDYSNINSNSSNIKCDHSNINSDLSNIKSGNKPQYQCYYDVDDQTSSINSTRYYSNDNLESEDKKDVIDNINVNKTMKNWYKTSDGTIVNNDLFSNPNYLVNRDNLDQSSYVINDSTSAPSRLWNINKI